MAQKRKMTEKETINVILTLARQQGVEEKVKKLIVKYQDAVKGAKDDYQRHHIAAVGLAEIHRTIGCVGSLVVDHVEVIPEDTSYVNELNSAKGLVKLD